MENFGRKLIFTSGLLSLLAMLTPRAHAALIPPQKMATQTRIRVRLSESESKVLIRGIDLKMSQALTRDTVQRTLASVAPESSEWEFRCQDDRIRAISTTKGTALTLKNPVVISSPAGLIRYRGKPYREEITIHSNGSLCEVVNELEIEKYLSGLVNAEFSSHWNQEAVQAQVIAARTYAIFQMKQAREIAARTGQRSWYDVDATTKDQVYDGYVSEDFKGERAVANTRGMVLVARAASGRLEPIKAFYHASCAGETLLPEDVWGSHFAGFAHRVTCPFCATSSQVRWNISLTADDLGQKIAQSIRTFGPEPSWHSSGPSSWKRILSEGVLVDLRAGNYRRSNRVATVLSVWQVGGRAIVLPISAVRFRDWMGAARLKSTSFQIVPDRLAGNAAFRFIGRGNGHGVGMCQLGAKYYGERGFKTAVILKHYYPDAILQKLW